MISDFGFGISDTLRLQVADIRHPKSDIECPLSKKTKNGRPCNVKSDRFGFYSGYLIQK
jgi:hypothetical protein